MNLKTFVLLITSMLFMPSCDKEVPLEFDCVSKDCKSMQSETLEIFEIEPLDEKDNWREDINEKEKVEKELAQRGITSRESS